MSRIKDIKRQLEIASEAIEALDAELAAGRLGIEEHGRQRAEREREAGRLFVSLRRGQRETGGHREPPPPAPAGPRPAWFRSPLAMGAASVLLVFVGIGAGVGVGRWFTGAQEAAAPAPAPSPAPAGDQSALMTEIELRALRQVAAREDAPIESLLQLGHVALDKGRLDEARLVYERVLAREPRNVEAITHVGAVLFQEGRVDEALAKVEAALRVDPRYVHAHWDRTQYLFYGKRDFPAAVTAAQAFLAVVPQGPDADNVRKLLAEAQQQRATGAPLIPKAR
ncbi:MAG: tetratricopeptide repeat protein [Candidatus Rokubacteria bacterium]|nr:tetratricopeptide repeat protein [Candidatus Rokubacteria bacterium]